MCIRDRSLRGQEKGRGHQLESGSSGLFQGISGRDRTSLPEVDRSLSSRLCQKAQEAGHEVGGVAYSGALGRKFLRLDQFLKSTSAKAEENVPNPKLFQ